MSTTAANPPMPDFRDDYELRAVDTTYLAAAVRPKQFIHIDQSECIQCEGCVDICPWKCLFMLSPSVVADANGTDLPGEDPTDNAVFVIDDDVCTRCGLCVDRCPTGVVILGTLSEPGPQGDPHQRSEANGSVYGLRLA